MKHFFITLFISLCFLTLNAQSMHTLYIDTTNTSPPYSFNNDTTVVIQYGDSLTVINKIPESMRYYFWINDNDPFFDSPVFFNTTNVPENDTILRLKFLHNSSCESWADNWSHAGVVFHFQVDVFMIAGGDFDKRIFFNYSNTNSLNQNDEFSPDNIMIYPSPARDIINVSGITSETINFNIYSLSGKLIKSGGVYSDRKIDIRNLPQGNYLLHLSTPNKIKVLKFVKL